VLQDVRAERTLARRAGLVLAYSTRVARHLGDRAQVVPIAYPVPPEPLPVIEAPVAMLMADWLWPPNKMALDRLLGVWPQVKDLLPGATLLLAGRMLSRDAIGSVPGVKVLGSVGASVDVLSQAAVLAFPCPASSGPKVKVLEALAYGVPVVTTPPGVEGLVLGHQEGAVVAAPGDFARALADLLSSPERRALLAQSGRAAVLAHHSPVASAQARLDAFALAFGPD
jgi:glycosyltransferase involved in cell wall biosynthesis